MRSRLARKLGRDDFVATRKGLEQATPLAVARARAERIVARMPRALVLDATCGIGADTIALARAAARLVASDRDALVASCAQWNLLRCGAPGHVVVAAADHPAVAADALVLDPDRRAGRTGQRSLDPRAWSPDWDRCVELASAHRGACLKLAPGVDRAALTPLPRPCAWSWVSLDGELVETTLWTGELFGDAHPDEREAIALRSRGPNHVCRAVPTHVDPLADVTDVAFVAEPDPAWIRAGLVGNAAVELGMAPLGPSIAYLGGPNEPPPGPWRRFRVLAHESADRKRVRALLRAHDVGPVVVHKRGHPLGADELARRFRGPGRRSGELIVSRTTSGHAVLLVERS